jgi:DNA-directed RNA polymerase specialized sigma24 family protein
MSELQRLDDEAGELLTQIATDPGGECARRFDTLLYAFVFGYLRANADRIAARVAGRAGVSGTAAPAVLAEELSEVAHDATTIALRRVREKAARFNPRRGTPTGWVIGAAEFAFVEVAKSVVAARRSQRLAFYDPQDLEFLAGYAPSTEEHVLAKVSSEQALEEAAEVLSEREWTAIRLVNTLHLSHAEAAEAIFGDGGMARSVDGLLTRGRSKLAAAWRERRAAPGAGAAGKVSGDGAEDTGGENA